MPGDPLADLSTAPFTAIYEREQAADFIEREAQGATAHEKPQSAQMLGPVDAMARGGTRRCRQEPLALPKSDGLGMATGKPCEAATAEPGRFTCS